jgi:hypothetical protein
VRNEREFDAALERIAAGASLRNWEIPALCGTGQLSLKEGGTFSTFMTLH